MKPYRGMHLAAAVLLAALPLSGCGNADHYAESGGVTLTSDITTVEKTKEVVFTVVGTPTATTTAASAKTIVPECDMLLEYYSEGAGVSRNWTSLAGTAATRVFKLTPIAIGTLSVLARGKCSGSNEEWQYSSQVRVTVTDKVLPTVSGVTLAANPSSVAKNKPVTFTLGATKSDKCTLMLAYQYSGAGFSGVTTVNPAYIGQFILTPTAVGTLSVTATGWCTENSSALTSTTTTVSVTLAETVTVTAPSAPTFVTPPVPNVGVDWSFSSGGSTCSNGETVEYQFSATGSPSAALPYANPSGWMSTPSFKFNWGSAGGPWTVSVQARCATSTGVVSSTVNSAAITVSP